MSTFTNDQNELAGGLSAFGLRCHKAYGKLNLELSKGTEVHMYPVGFNVQVPVKGIELAMNLGNLATGEILSQVTSGLVFRSQADMELALDILMPELQILLGPKASKI